MIGYIVAGAATVDAFALGVWVGKKWGNKVNLKAIEALGAGAEAEVVRLRALLASYEAKAMPAPVVVPAPVTTPEADALRAKIAAAVASATAGVAAATATK